MTKRTILVLTVVAVMATAMALAIPAFAAPADTDADVQKGLAQVRQATAKYHDVEEALADGYLATHTCVEVPGLGGMGYHYVKPALVGDPSVNPLEPELLLYAPSGNGQLKLVGVEYFVVDADQDLSTDEDRPSLFGVPFDGPMPGHEPEMPVHYDLHAWVWQANPIGIFAPFNPNVHC